MVEWIREGTEHVDEQRMTDPSHRQGRSGPTSAPPPQDSIPPELLINRELSWLAFNQRVLEEAEREDTPLLERVKFAAIFAANLDEFFMIRVANLRRKLTAGMTDPGPDGRSPLALAKVLKATTQGLLDRHARLVCGELIPALRANSIHVVAMDEVSDAARSAIKEFFRRELFPVLTPQAIERARRFPHVSNQSLNLIVELRAPEVGERFARVKVPAVLPRLFKVDSESDEEHEHYVWLEDVIASQLGRLFPGNTVVAAYPFHVIRDSDIEIDDDEDVGGDLLIEMERQLSQRTFGAVVQLVCNASMPVKVRVWLADQLHATERDVYVVDGPLAMKGLFDLVKIDRPYLHDPLLIPTQLGIGDIDENVERTYWGTGDIFARIRESDVMAHHPYQSFGAVTEFLRNAARDLNVVAIKQTLYRLGKSSPIIPELVVARDDDTQIAVLMEVKARFDEENNIALAHELETAGVHVAYGLPGLKTHSKMMLVVRREADGLRRYVHLSTGNYNASTARTYEDIGMFTARADIGEDVSELFNVLTGYAEQESYRRLWVAPRNLRTRVVAAIARETVAHRAEGDGRIILKMNSLVDREVIRALYDASRAGVEIDLIVRGICCLRPGVPGWSETIRVRSLVGRFLEHSRIFHFRHGGADELLMGSADMMERNLDRRVEVVFPVEDPRMQADIRDVLLPAYLRDTANARSLAADGVWSAVRPEDGEEPFDLHSWLIEHYRTKQTG